MDGIVIINKPLGLTSQQVVSKVKKILNEKKAGHTGTLDPFATGVLPILLGKGTKLSQYLIEHDKKYIATIYLGEKKDTGDQEGITIEKRSVPILSEEEIKLVLESFKGEQKQIPPMYSAIKINGKKLYEYARNGEKVERPEREIKIYEINFIEKKENLVKFEVSCSKGTYIRVLCEDIAEKLGTVGYMSALERTLVNDFQVENAISLEELQENIDKIISIEEYFSQTPKINLTEKKVELLLNGVKLTYNLEDGFYRIYNTQNEFLGIAKAQNQLLKRELIL
ncbi:MAG: tRNA pseudouridine(55) synthase TruB [Clostridia bacterium]|nr:tRNA pseudouridine(55) synthase TruB [Clostridia bacterium]